MALLPHMVLSLSSFQNPSLSDPLSSAATRPLGMSGLPLKRVLGQEDRPVSLVTVLCVCGDRCVHSEQDGGVCQEVFGWSVEFLSTSGVDSCKRVNSMKLCLLVSCLSVSGSRDKRGKSCVSECRWVCGYISYICT